jgi:hypothetical protein
VSKRAGADPVQVVGYRRHLSPPGRRPARMRTRALKDGLLAGESIYFDLATLCEQAGVSVDEIRAAAKEQGGRRFGPVPGS